MKITIVLSVLFLLPSLAKATIPEASGVTKVGDMVVIAGDEEPRALWTSKNKRTPEKIKVQGHWDDLEGLATLDTSRFFAITSQSLTKKGKRRPEREQLMLLTSAPKISVEKIFSPRESILKFLETKLAGEIDMNILRTGTPDEGGLNVEGLAYTNGKLYLGLRSPLTRNGEGIIIEMSNPATNPIPTRVIRVRLGGNGIRSLDADQKGLIVLSGPSSDQGSGFGLHRMNLITNEINPLRLPGFERLIRPEGVITEAPGSYLFVQDFENSEDDEVIVRITQDP